MKKRLLIIPAFVVLVGTTILTTDSVNAFGFGNGNQDEMVSRFAERLGKSEDEVRVIFQEMHQEHMGDMQGWLEDSIDEAIADGTITEEQSQLIMAKHQETRTMYQDMWGEMQEMSPEDRRATMQAHHDEMTAWAEENGIDFAALQLGDRSHMGSRGMHGSHRGL